MFSDNFILNVIAVLLAVIFAIVTYSKWVFNHWKKLGVPCIRSKSPPEDERFGIKLSYPYREAKARGYRHVGLYKFMVPMYMPIDLELIRRILSKDFSHFTDRGYYYNKKDDPLSAHLFLLEGDTWKSLRSKITPTFSIGKTKLMFHIIAECSRNLKEAMDIECKKGPLNVKEVFERYAMDVIGSCAFGINCNSFSNPNTEFCVYARKIFRSNTLHDFKTLFSFMFPNVATALRLSALPRDVTQFFLSITKKIIEIRETNNVIRNDYMQLLIDLLKKDILDADAITIEEAAAEAFLFFLAASETTSLTMSFCLFELCLNQNIQQKMRDEINEVSSLHNGILTFESLNELIYMEEVFEEVLRKYPPVPLLDRVCTKDFQIPSTNIVIEKGTRVSIPVIGIQHDPEYFFEPEKFDPERFSKENRANIKSFTYMPFGDGPRACFVAVMFSDNFIFNMIAILLTVIFAIVTYSKWVFNHWQKLGVPCIRPTSPPEDELFAIKLSYPYREAKKRGYRHVGFYKFMVPMYMPIDLELIRSILSKDFNHFTDHGYYYNKKDDPLSAHLFMLNGDTWRSLRSKITPTFSIGKTKLMFNNIYECSHNLKEAMDIECKKGPLNIIEVFERYGMNVIGSCAFGINCNSFTNPNNEFCVYARKIFRSNIVHDFKTLFSFMFPNVATALRLSALPRDVTQFFLSVTKKIIEIRETNNVVRNDYMQLLINLLKKDTLDADAITIEEAAAEAFLFFLAAFETTSLTMSFCLFELCLNQNIQQKMRDEINEVSSLHNGILTFESLNELIYMEKVLEEVLRKYPPVPLLDRVCTKDFQIPGTNIIIEKGTRVTIPSIGIQHDPEYFPEPEKFDPERFSIENRTNIKSFAYMPFGDGPRACFDGNWKYSVRLCVEECQIHFQNIELDDDVLCRHIRRIVSRFHEHVSVCKGKSTGRTTVLTEEVVEDVRTHLERSPTKPLRRLAQQTGNFALYKT
ncbi:hypothetical protein FQA39_LY01745 [Lamprigera yunnana]|nr:hypothetical protein FQA39_LY01745 [Lamprigera yunnana]